MSDLAEGSKAVNQLQQNIAAAPYVGDLTKAASERKIQEDRLAAQYAPQEAAMKIAQEEQTLQQTKLANLVGQAKIDMTVEKKAAITKLTADPEYAKLSPEDQSRKLAGAVMGIDTADGERLIKIADSEQAKSYINKLKEHETNRLNIADGLATVRGATDEQFQGLIEKMPEDMKKAIKMHIPGFFEERDPKLQRAQLEALMNNGEGKNNMAANEQRLKVLDLQIEKAQKSLEIAEQVYKNKQAKGSGSDVESKVELREYAQFNRASRGIDIDYKKPLQEADAAWKKAVKEDEKKVGIFAGFGGGTPAIDQAKAAAAKGDTKKLAELPSTKAWRELQELKLEVVDKKLNALEGMHEGKEKDRLYKSLMDYKESIDTTSYGPPEKAAPKSDSSPAAVPGAAVPSNKGTDSKTAALPPPKSKDLAVDGQRYDLGDKGVLVWDKASDSFLPEAEYKKSKPTTTPAAKDTSKDFKGAKSADLIEKGNIDLTKRPVVTNKDGSISTVRSMSFEEDGMQILIPTVVGDKVVSDKAAIDHYHKTGEHLGMFSSVKAANAYAKKLHEEQDKMYSGKKEKSTAETLRELADMKQKSDALKKANDKKEKDLKEAEKRIAKLKQLAGE